MGHASEALEHAEHVAHAGHGADSLSKRAGITMALLGVVLAFAAAKVGGQRAELTKALVDQQHAHAKFTQSDIKHRVAVLALRQIHASADTATNANDAILVANTVERYLEEAKVADEWVDTYDPLVLAHSVGQEHYELAQLAAEIGIVIASIALLLKRRDAWLISVGCGVVAIALLGWTYLSTHHVVEEAEVTAEHSEAHWEELHAANKTDAVDAALVDDIRHRYGAAAGSSVGATAGAGVAPSPEH